MAQTPDTHTHYRSHARARTRLAPRESHHSLQIGQQLTGEEDIWLRNGGINELAPGRAVFWRKLHATGRMKSILPPRVMMGLSRWRRCRSKVLPLATADHDGGDEGVEFMHYFNGATAAKGCLRVIPGALPILPPPSTLRPSAAKERCQRALPKSAAKERWPSCRAGSHRGPTVF